MAAATVAAALALALRDAAEWRVRRVNRRRKAEVAAAASRTTRRGVTLCLSFALAEMKWVLSLAFRACMGLVILLKSTVGSGYSATDEFCCVFFSLFGLSSACQGLCVGMAIL